MNVNMEKLPFNKFPGLELHILNFLSLPDDAVKQIGGLYHHSYRASGWVDKFQREIKNKNEGYLFAVTDGSENIVAVRTIFTKEHSYYDNLLKLFEYLNVAHVPRGTSMTVVKPLRGKGIGEDLVNISNNYIFDKLKVPYIVGDSRHLDAIHLYLKCGAQMYQSDIDL